MKLFQESMGSFRPRFSSEKTVCGHASTYGKEKPEYDESYIQEAREAINALSKFDDFPLKLGNWYLCY